MKRIGIVILATNAYFVLGIRLMRRFMHHYKGDCEITFYFFSDQDPQEYLPEGFNYKFYPQTHTNWVEGTNSKFKNIVNIQYDLRSQTDYVYYFDADTNVIKDFTEEWFLGEMVSGEHYGNRSFLANGKGFDRNPRGKSYVPMSSSLPYTYRYGAFFGGATIPMILFCERLMKWQIIDKDKGYEPPVNDESYINAFFHFLPPTLTVPTEGFKFEISDKGGLGETRQVNLDISEIKESIKANRDKIFDLKFNKIIYV